MWWRSLFWIAPLKENILLARGLLWAWPGLCLVLELLPACLEMEEAVGTLPGVLLLGLGMKFSCFSRGGVASLGPGSCLHHSVNAENQRLEGWPDLLFLPVMVPVYAWGKVTPNRRWRNPVNRLITWSNIWTKDRETGRLVKASCTYLQESPRESVTVEGINQFFHVQECLLRISKLWPHPLINKPALQPSPKSKCPLGGSIPPRRLGAAGL